MLIFLESLKLTLNLALWVVNLAALSGDLRMPALPHILTQEGHFEEL
jgi:hypothetical protein